MPTVVPDHPHVFRRAADWEAWLAKHHAFATDAWLVIGKKSAAEPMLAIGDALDVALCFGWIDSQRKGRDDQTFLQRYSRRGPHSPWSRINVEKAEALIRSGRMQAAGIAEITRAKADGRWAGAYESQKNVTTPADLAAALKGSPKAAAAFERLDKTARYAVILPLLKATTVKVRAARLEKALASLSTASPKAERARALKKNVR